MKQSNILLILLSLILLRGIYITDRLLARQYLKVNLDDPYKNFDSVAVQPFKALRITGGNGYAIRIMQGNNFTARVMHSRKSFYSMNALTDTLAIGFAVANQDYQRPEKCTVGLIITLPRLDFLQLSGTNNEVGQFHQDTLIIQQDKNTVTRLKDLQVDCLNLQGSGLSYFDFIQNNNVGNLIAHLQNNASMDFHQVNFKQFNPVLRDTAAIVLYRQSLEMARVGVIASDRSGR
ncbi:MAG: hypothetical protein ABIN89_29510 [Chitinophagaceae bacterium]